MSCEALHEGPAAPCVMVVFGASGDLAKRKLIPALFNLRVAGLLSDRFSVVGFSRSEVSDADYRKQMAAAIKEHVSKEAYDEDLCKKFVSRLHYVAGDSSKPADYAKLKDALAKIDRDEKTEGNYLFYMAVPPKLFAEIPRNLSSQGLLEEKNGSWRKLIIEKPFGRDLKSAIALNKSLLEYMREKQIYRMDHYLGKETVQNMMVLRFANGIFEPIWNRRYIDSVRVTVAETLGVESRAAYYDHTGAMRDMVPNHLFQLLALIGMEPPNSFKAEEVRDEKVKLLKATKIMCRDEISRCVVRAQYGAGSLDGKKIQAYRAEDDVKKNSGAETFVALKLEIDNWRWSGVPFYLRTGKRLKERVSEIIVQFKAAPVRMFADAKVKSIDPDRLVIQIQPDEKISLCFAAKLPGPGVRLRDVKMDFDYLKTFATNVQTGYETLLYDCMIGDATLFQRADQIEAAWNLIAPILAEWEKRSLKGLETYASGAWGPESANELLERDGREWRHEPS